MLNKTQLRAIGRQFINGRLTPHKVDRFVELLEESDKDLPIAAIRPMFQALAKDGQLTDQQAFNLPAHLVTQTREMMAVEVQRAFKVHDNPDYKPQTAERPAHNEYRYGRNWTSSIRQS